LSLQAILTAIYAAGENQIDEIATRARAQVAELLAQAEIDGQRLRKETHAQAIQPAAAERARILHQARLEAMQIVGDAREALVDMALSRTRERLTELRSDPAYPATLSRLTEEALAELGSSEITAGARLKADLRDRKLLEDLLVDLEPDLPIVYELHGWGGIVAESEDSRIVVTNGLESRLERAIPFLRLYLPTMFAEADEDKQCLAMTMAMPAYEL
jgi:vacuolar-type H+-ATPase subunit E/Vma4